jgi:hypothetical protein
LYQLQPEVVQTLLPRAKRQKDPPPFLLALTTKQIKTMAMKILHDEKMCCSIIRRAALSVLMIFLVVTVSAFQHMPSSDVSTGFPPRSTASSSSQPSLLPSAHSFFLAADNNRRRRQDDTSRRVSLSMAQVSQQEAQKAIDTVVKALRKDSSAKSELGKLNKVENVLGFGMPQPGKIAVRFNASFQKSGGGRSGLKLGGGGGGDKKKNDSGGGRGTMVGQVKASVDQKTGKIAECSVFRDLGYGRSFNLRI